MPKLTICVPSRNRQVYFQQTILSLIENGRMDVEFVFADNSDDGSIMASFLGPLMARLGADPRIRFLPSPPAILSRIDNWERAVAASSGDWVTVIGDGDYADPDIATILLKIELFVADTEAFSWAVSDFAWPVAGKSQASSSVLHLQPQFIDLPRDWLFRRAFLWGEATYAPAHGFSIYHSALSRPLLERMRARFGGRYFQQPGVEFESSLKAILIGTRFIHWERPLSIQGRCPQGDAAIHQRLQPYGRTDMAFMYDDGAEEGMPFHGDMGVPACLLMTQQQIKSAIGMELEGWQENFVRACERYCASMRSREAFDVISNRYSAAFAAWENGRYAALFNPVHEVPAENPDLVAGLKGRMLHINNCLSGAQTPKDAYDLMMAMVPPLEETLIDPSVLRHP